MIRTKRGDYETGEALEFFGPALPDDYEPPGLWSGLDALDLDGKTRAPVKCSQASASNLRQLELFGGAR